MGQEAKRANIFIHSNRPKRNDVIWLENDIKVVKCDALSCWLGVVEQEQRVGTGKTY